MRSANHTYHNDFCRRVLYLKQMFSSGLLRYVHYCWLKAHNNRGYDSVLPKFQWKTGLSINYGIQTHVVILSRFTNEFKYVQTNCKFLVKIILSFATYLRYCKTSQTKHRKRLVDLSNHFISRLIPDNESPKAKREYAFMLICTNFCPFSPPYIPTISMKMHPDKRIKFYGKWDNHLYIAINRKSVLESGKSRKVAST